MPLAKPMVHFDTPEGRYSAGDASLYARPGDTDDFAERVVELLDNPEKARLMDKAGRRRFLDSLHWGHSVQVLYAAYGKVLGCPLGETVETAVPTDLKGHTLDAHNWFHDLADNAG